MFNLHDLKENQHSLIVAALQSALSVTPTMPMFFELYDGREKPTEAEARVADEFIRYCLVEQSVPTGWYKQFSSILSTVCLLWRGMLEDNKRGAWRTYGYEVDDAQLEMLDSFAEMFWEME